MHILTLRSTRTKDLGQDRELDAECSEAWHLFDSKNKRPLT